MISVTILAGGQSKRMGQDKAFLDVGGQTVIERVIERVQPLTDDLFISTNSPELYKQFGLRLEADVYPDKAALGGIYSAIYAAQHWQVLVVACDMPFLNTQLLRYLSTVAPQANVVAPLLAPPQPETMHTIYNKACLPAIKSKLLANKLRIISFFSEVTVHYVNRDEIIKLDPNLHSFVNMNSPADWQKAREMLNI